VSPRSSPSVTMDDVAQHAGVSPATVSRALSGTRPMSPELRDRVRQAAEDLGYRVNLVGRALRRRRSSTAGMVVPDLDNPFFSSLAQHLSRTFAPSGIDLLVFSADGDLDIELRGVQSFLGRQVDALVLIPLHESSSASTIATASSSVVTVQLDRQTAATSAHFVGCDNFAGMELIAEHVRNDVDVDRQPVVYIGGDASSSSGHERLAAFRRSFGSRPEVLLGSFDAAWGQTAADQLLAVGTTAATVLAGADVIALGVLNRLWSAGRHVPDDFRVVGFDGVGVSHLAHPTLTTVRQPVEAMSHAILDLVLQGLDDPAGQLPSVVRLAPEMILRESSPGTSG
jgi:LacI family transcriptional regulator